MGSTFRTREEVVSDCLLPACVFVHSALPLRNPPPVVVAEITLKVALTLAPGATGASYVTVEAEPPDAETVQPAGEEMFNFTSEAGVAALFVNVAVMSFADFGVNVKRRDSGLVARHISHRRCWIAPHPSWLRSDIRLSSRLHRRYPMNRFRCHRQCPAESLPVCAWGSSCCWKAIKGRIPL